MRRLLLLARSSSQRRNYSASSSSLPSSLSLSLSSSLSLSEYRCHHYYSLMTTQGKRSHSTTTSDTTVIPSSSSSPSSFLSSKVISCWMKDVIRTKSFIPTNPILDSLPSRDLVIKQQHSLLNNNNESGSQSESPSQLLSLLPDFSYMEPHHIEKIVDEIQRQFNLDLVQLEVQLQQQQQQQQQQQESNDNSESQSHSLSSLLLELDQIMAPVIQLTEVTHLFTLLASPPDQIDDWVNAADNVDQQTAKLIDTQLYKSRIIYRSLLQLQAQGSQSQHVSSNTAPSSNKVASYLVPFMKRGAHIGLHDDNDDESAKDDILDRYNGIQNELLVLNDRLGRITHYEIASKAMRLQCMSDMYNCIGLTRLQSQSIIESISEPGNKNDISVWKVGRMQHNHMVVNPQKELIETLFPEIKSYLTPYLPTKTKLNLDGVGAFLDNAGSGTESSGASSQVMNAMERKKLMMARYDYKQKIKLHGVLDGIIDFCDTVLGIHLVPEEEESTINKKGWNKNVRLFHLYQKENDTDNTDSDTVGDVNNNGSSNDDNKNSNSYLGTIYLDLFADPYWRTDDAKELITSHLFSSSQYGTTTASQTIVPVTIISLKLTPIWDDTPVPLSFMETRQLLYQFGKSIQLLLEQTNQRRQQQQQQSTNTNQNQNQCLPEPPPIDTSEFMAHFMEMWIQNDGFLNRLSQLSSTPGENNKKGGDDNSALTLAFDSSSSSSDTADGANESTNTLQILRHDLQKEKALQIMNTMFLSVLQLHVFDTFNPRGDETLVGLQERIANEYLPGTNLPDPADLSPLLGIFQQSGGAQSQQYMSCYSTLYSECLSASLYEKIQYAIVELRNPQEVTRLGTGIRDLFLPYNNNNNTNDNNDKNNGNSSSSCSFRNNFEKLLLSGSSSNATETNSSTNTNTTTANEKVEEGTNIDGDDDDDGDDVISISRRSNSIISGGPLKRVYQFNNKR